MIILDEKRQVTTRERFLIMERDSFKCIYCGCKAAETELHIDHVIPYSKGGQSDFNNLATACIDCNLGKSNLSIEKVNDILEEINKKNKIFNMNKPKQNIKNNKPIKKLKKKKEKILFDLENDIDNIVSFFLDQATQVDIKLLQLLFKKGKYIEADRTGYYWSKNGKYSKNEIFPFSCNYTYELTRDEFQNITGKDVWDWTSKIDEDFKLLNINKGISAKVYFDNIETDFSFIPYNLSYNNNIIKYEININFKPFLNVFIPEIMKINN